MESVALAYQICYLLKMPFKIIVKSFPMTIIFS